MRSILILLTVFGACLTIKAQTVLPVNGSSLMQPTFHQNNPLNDSTALAKKWSVTGYSGISAGTSFFNAGRANFLAAQTGLQLNRRINNNLYAFAGVAAGPALFNFNRPLNNTDGQKNYMSSPMFGANRWGLNAGLQAGLMYVNDARTFSISGSIGVSNRSYPFYPAAGIPAQSPAFLRQ
jgi:hypothetical protein